jgi:hypothetical protein
MENKNHESNGYFEHFDQAKLNAANSEPIQQNSMNEPKNVNKQKKPWYKNGFIMLFAGAFILLVFGFFTSQMTEALQGIGASIEHQTEAIREQNQTLSVQNEILRGIEQGLSDIENKLGQWVVEVEKAFSKFTS